MASKAERLAAKDKLLPKTRFDGHTPDEPHLVFYTGTGQAAAFKRGNVIGIVMDPTRRSPHMRMAISKVTEQALHFKCICNPTCTVQWVYRLDQTGVHAR